MMFLNVFVALMFQVNNIFIFPGWF